MEQNERLEKLARAVIHNGVCLQKGQPAVIKAQVEMAPAVRAIAKEAWKAGASDVEVIWSDSQLDRDFYLNASDDVLSSPPEWMSDRLNQLAEKGAAFISLSGSDPDGLAGVDSSKMMQRSMAMSQKTRAYREGIDNGSIAWTVVAVPTRNWAKKVYPNLSEEQAMESLWEDVMTMTRLEGDVDQNWKDHTDDLQSKVNRLNALDLVRFHYTSSNGTDLWVDLPEGCQFVGGATELVNGLSINCNMPTEEIFTTPEKTSVNGQLEAVMPLNWNGKLIDGFGFTFKDGQVIDFHAVQGEDDLRALLDSDPNGRCLGEMALVDKNSPIRQMGRIYYNTLIDENASCHFALGQSYAETLPGAKELSRDELEKRGMNQSDIHVDFMVGADDLRITGYDRDGQAHDVFVDGGFIASFDRNAEM